MKRLRMIEEIERFEYDLVGAEERYGSSAALAMTHKKLATWIRLLEREHRHSTNPELLLVGDVINVKEDV